MSGTTGPKRSILGRIGDRLRFALELVVLRGLGYRLLLAATIVAVVAVLGGMLAFGLAGGFDGPDDAVWWAFLRLTDPGYLGDDEGSALRVISTLVTVLGYLLFLGLLIAILTQWLNQTLQRLESGVTPIALSDHVIVLGCTGRTPAIVAGLLGAQGRMRRFLAEHNVRELRVVVLVEGVDQALRQELRERLGDLWDDRRILLRCGSPLRLDHLERVAFREAAALVLPGADFAERRPEAADAEVVKTLVSVSKNAREGGCEAPRAVAEIFDARQATIADRAYDGEVEILATDRMVSRLIAQAVHQSGLHDVFHELFSLGLGNAVFLRPLPELAGTRFGALQGTLPNGIPLGLVRPDESDALLHPDPQTVLGPKDALVVMARSFDDCGARVSGAPRGADAPPAACRPAPRGRWFAVGIRAVLGALFLIAAPECRLPEVVRIAVTVSGSRWQPDWVR